MFRRAAYVCLIVVSIIVAGLTFAGCGGGSGISVALSSNSANNSIEQGQTTPLTLTAAVTGDTTGVTWGAVSCSGSNCGSLSNTSTSGATYNPPSGTLASNLQVTVTAASAKDPTKTGSITINVIPSPTVSTAVSTTPATINQAYSVPLVNGGTPPFALHVSGGTAPSAVQAARGKVRGLAVNDCSGLPFWLVFDTQTGRLNGAGAGGTIPSSATNFACTLQVTDSIGITSPSIAVTISVPVSVMVTTLPATEQTVSYSASLTAAGGSGSYSGWAVTSGSLPAGLTLGADGSISGTVGSSATTQSFTVQVTDTNNVSGTQPLSINVAPALAITSPAASSLTANIGAAFSLTLQTATGTGVGPFNWSSTGLPSWLSLSSAGVLSAGTSVPTAATNSQFTVQVKDSFNVTKTLPLTVAVPLKITTASLPNAEQTGAYNSSLTAVGGSGTYSSWTVSSGTLPAGLALGADGKIAGTVANTATSQTFTVQVTDSANATGSQQYSISIAPLVAITAPSAASLTANIGAAYSVTLGTATGTGVGPFTWSVAQGSALPSWLSLSNAGVLSASAAVPTTATTSGFTVQVKDANNIVATLPVTVTVPIQITTASLPNAEQTGTYSSTLSAVGGSGTYSSWTVITGSLPTGLTLGANGQISGTVANTATSQTFTVQVTDSSNATGSQQYNISIAPLVAIATPMSASLTANIGSAYSLTLQTSAGTGVGPFTWALAQGSNLPAWLSFSASGTLSASAAVPTTATTSQLTVQVKDANNIVATLPLMVTVPIQITTASLPNAEQTGTYNSTLTAIGGSGTYSTWTVSSGSLPTGLTLGANGAITGTVANTATSQTFTVQVTDSNNATGSQQYSISIAPLVAITAPSAASLTANIGAAYSLTLGTATGTGVGPFTWSVAQGSALPNWLSLSSAGVLSASAAVPTTATTSGFTVQVKDANNIVATLPVTVTVPIQITTASLPATEQTLAYPTTNLAAIGGSGTYSNWSVITGSLPNGLTLAANGALSGTATVTATTQVFTVQVTDSKNATATKQFTISINSQLKVTPPSAASLTATIGNAFSLSLQPDTGTGVAPYNWSVAQGSTLPAWLSFTTAGLLSVANQVPTTATTASFTVQVTDASNVTVSVPLTVTVPLVIVSGSLSSGEVTLAYNSGALIAQGGSGAYTWSATGLPAWASISASTGAITGSPTSGNSNLSIKVTDSLNANVTKAFTLNIFPVVAVSTTSLPGATVNTAYSQTLAAAGGVSPYTWHLTGALPSGLTLDTSTGAITGSAGCPGGTSNFSVTAKDSLNVTSASQALSIVNSTPPLTISTTTVPNALADTAYSQQLQATGGALACGGSITWTVVSGSLPSWLTLSNAGVLSGTPGGTDAGTVSFTVQVSDGVNTPVTQGLTFVVSAGAGHSVSGTVSLTNNGGPLSGVSVTIGSQTVNTDNNGNYTVQNVPGGTQSVSLSYTPSPGALFLPQSGNITSSNGLFTITVGSSDLTGINFNAAVGYVVSGNVSYFGTAIGNSVYVTLQNQNCATCPILGTNIPGTGTYVVQGVPPGTYSMNAWMDRLGYGIFNLLDPSASTTVTVSVATGNVTNASVTLKDSTQASTLSGTNPVISGMASGAVIEYQPMIKNGVEQAFYYELQWSSQNLSSCINSPDGGISFLTSSQGLYAGGSKVIVLDGNNASAPWFGGFTDGTFEFYCMRAAGIDTHGNLYNGNWNNVTSKVGAPTGGNTLSLTVNWDSSVSIPAQTPLYVGCHDTTNSKSYLASDLAPASGNTYNIDGIPTGTQCQLIAFFDINNNGQDTPANPSFSLQGDISTSRLPSTTVVVNGATSKTIDITPFAGNSTASLKTQHTEYNSTENYNLNFGVNALVNLPVTIELAAGPNVVLPTDFPACFSCYYPGQFTVSLPNNGLRPQVNDVYSLIVTYADQTAEQLDVTVTGVVDNFATGLAQTGTTTPTFTWSYPSNASDYTYLFMLWDANGNSIWQIPGASVASTGFTSSISPSIAWGTDPTGATNAPSVTSLTSGKSYSWGIGAQDSNGNTAQTLQTFSVP